jgi:hypothetical protein
MENTTTHFVFFRDFFLFGLPFSFFDVNACMMLLPFSSGDGDLLFCGVCWGAKGSCKWDLLFGLDPFFVIIGACSLSLSLTLSRSRSLSFPVDMDGIDCLLACGVQEKERVAALNGILVLKQILFFFSFLAILFMSSSHREGCQLHCHINLLLSDHSTTCPGPWVFLLINLGYCKSILGIVNPLVDQQRLLKYMAAS